MTDKDLLIDSLVKTFTWINETRVDIANFSWIVKAMLDSAVKQGLILCSLSMNNDQATNSMKPFIYNPIYIDLWFSENKVEGNISAFGYNIKLYNLDLTNISKDSIQNCIEVTPTVSLPAGVQRPQGMPI